MKNSGLYITPGRLDLAVRYEPDWECDCPGTDELKKKEIYFITGVLHNEHGRRYLRVSHKTLVKPWSEKILNDMENNRTAYPELIFRPSLSRYRSHYLT